MRADGAGGRRGLAGALLALALLAIPAPAPAAPAGADPSGPAIAARARAEVGVSASARKCQPYGPLCVDWCAMFATWVWEQAGIADVPRGEYVATALGAWGRQRGLFSGRPAGSRGGDPRPGDLIVYGEPAQGLGGHVAVVAAVHRDGTLTTVDGNFGNRVTERRVDPLLARAGADNLAVSGYVRPPGGARPALPAPPGAAAAAPAAPTGSAPDLVAIDSDGRLVGRVRSASPRRGAGPAARSAAWRDAARDWSAVVRLARADVDRDGRADLVTTRTDGALTVHRHAADVPAGASPYGDPTLTVAGQWHQLRHLTAADLTGDGRADLVGVDAAGALVGFVHTGDAAAPWRGQPTWRIPGWVGTRQLVLADFDRDRHADAVVAAADGSLHGFRYDAAAADAGRPPFGAAAWRSADPRWAAHRQLASADADRDGYGDLMAVAPGGDLVVYRNSRARGGPPFTAEGWRVPGGWLTTRALG
ncbi:MAG TPA: FG-GAP-like repeat-containing protein [Pilimelia sp.]|nr:FG-GAP-like repeat-containing protein [Pilimelia sp.]